MLKPHANNVKLSEKQLSHFQVWPFQDSGNSSGICAKLLEEARYRSFEGKSCFLCLLELRVSSMRVTMPLCFLDEIGRTAKSQRKRLKKSPGPSSIAGEMELWWWVNQSTFDTSRFGAHRSTWTTVLQLVVQQFTNDLSLQNLEPCALRHLIDNHYGCVAEKAVNTDPHDLVIPDDALKSFEDQFEFL